MVRRFFEEDRSILFAQEPPALHDQFFICNGRLVVVQIFRQQDQQFGPCPIARDGIPTAYHLALGSAQNRGSLRPVEDFILGVTRLGHVSHIGEAGQLILAGTGTRGLLREDEQVLRVGHSGSEMAATCYPCSERQYTIVSPRQARSQRANSVKL